MEVCAALYKNRPSIFSFLLNEGRACPHHSKWRWRTQHNVPRYCYRNALMEVCDHPELTYVEGYATREGIGFPVEHAWVVLPNGAVIDPTWDSTDLTGSNYWGIPFRTGWVRTMALKTGHAGILTDPPLVRQLVTKAWVRNRAIHRTTQHTLRLVAAGCPIGVKRA